jgi:rubrerythrin/rubredoxin
MAGFDAADALEMAMAVEKNGEVFYNAVAQKAVNPQVKTLFEALAVQEQGHYDVFWKLAGGMEHGQPLAAFDEYKAYLYATMRSALFSGPEKALAAAEHVQNERAALQMAIDFERDTLLFFYDLSEMVGKADQPIVAKIIQEEKAHIRRLAEYYRGEQESGKPESGEQQRVEPAAPSPSQNWWKCSECGFTTQASMPPEQCPSCRQKCAFIDVTCYTPECGGPGSSDPQLLGSRR